MRHFVDNSLEDSNFTTGDILNFLYTGPEEWREPGMLSFDWRNVFNAADQLLRTFNQYVEVRHVTAALRRTGPRSSSNRFPGRGAGRLCWGLPGLPRQVHQSSRSAPRRLQQGPFLKLNRPLSTTIKNLWLEGERTNLLPDASFASIVEAVIKWRGGGSQSAPVPSMSSLPRPPPLLFVT